MPKFKDSREVEEKNAGGVIYRIKIGLTTNAQTVAQNRDLTIAQTMCDNLNKDRWFLDRGQTRADRALRQSKVENV